LGWAILNEFNTCKKEKRKREKEEEEEERFLD
jgi:hypothetical protein